VKLTGTQYPASAGSTSDTGLVSATGGTQLLYHAKRWGRIIAATHFDDPDTPDVIEGYVVKAASERSCRDCHDVHKGGVAINEEWAKSGHGGKVLEAKEAAAAGATDRTLAQSIAVQTAGTPTLDPITGDPVLVNTWADNDWDSAEEEECQVCHTATGFSNFMKNPASYDPALNNYSHLVDWTADDPATADVDEAVSSGQNEMLYCWGCHKNNAGGVKTSDAVILVDRDGTTFATLGTADAGLSVVCVKCHGGRANGEYLKTTSASRSTSSRVHYLPAAGVLYAAKTHTLYEFPDLVYTPVAYFKHDKLGLNADTPETGKGPCAACHMDDAGHSLAAVTLSDLGVITAITNAETCATAGCHVGEYAMTAEKLEEQKTGFTAANKLLSDYLNNVVVNYINLDIDNSTNVTNALVTLNDYGALQNQKTLANDPGAYAHNRIYAQRIIFDSIDQLDNGTLDGTLDLSAYPVVAEWLQEDGNAANDNAVVRPPAP
jgi:mono/diheme cytochrome c family protein